MFVFLSQFAHLVLAIDPTTGALSAGGAVVLLVGLWLPFVPGARRRRAFRRAQLSFQQGAWQEALTLIKEQQAGGRLPLMWEGRLRNLEGECQRFAGQAALTEQRYEDALEHLLGSARLLGLNGQEERARVIDAMLDGVRKLFAAGSASETDAAMALAGRVLALEPNRAEALFWRGLCLVRQERFDEALAALRATQEAEATGCVDPCLYLGALSLRQGAKKDAVRYLSEANRLAANCPLATWQLGMAILAADGDSQVATRALQRARDRLAALQKSEKTAQQFWLGTLPEGKSYVRRLALKYPFVCPLFGNQGPALLREVQLGLGQALYLQGDFQESVQQYMAALHAGAPTVPVLRGLGQALARAERYEEAYNHLRAAFDGEDPKNPFTAGYLALCGARGKPSGPDDKIKNVQWALSLVAQFSMDGNKEWAALCNAIHAEARGLDLPIAADDQVRLCEALAALDATDVEAARAYEHLAMTFPERVRPVYAWLYCRAAQQQHACGKEHDLDLFARTFADEPAARAFCTERGWNFDDIEYAYLERASVKCPGRFPESLGHEYASRGAKLLLARSVRQEQSGDDPGALSSVEVLRALSPQNVQALDRLAQLHFRRGDLDRAAELLAEWGRLDPANPLPLARQAVIEQKRGQRDRYSAAIELALERAQAHDRASIAFLGARLVLADLLNGTHPSANGAEDAICWQRAIQWLTECLKHYPKHEDAIWCLAAVHALQGDRSGLASLATKMDRPDVSEARFQFMAACSHLAAGDAARTLDACSLSEKSDASLSAETSYVSALAHAAVGDRVASARELEKVIQAKNAFAADHALALAAQFSFADRHYEDALEHWESVSAAKRTEWGLDEPLRQTVFLSALHALQSGEFPHAAARLREAGRLGLRDRRLGGLLVLTLVRDGQRLLHEAVTDAAEARPENAKEKLELAARLLEQALNAGSRQPEVAYLLALAYKRQAKPREARAAFRRIVPADANVLLQLGLLSLREGQAVQAEGEFASAWQSDPHSFAIGFDLLMTRLTLGQIDASLSLLPRVVELAGVDAQQGLLRMLQPLLHFAQTGDMQSATSLSALTEEEERQLIELLRGIGHLETTCLLLENLGRARPESAAARRAYMEAVLVSAKQMLERCDWTGAGRLLTPLREVQAAPDKRAVFLNLLGCCECLGQEFKKGGEQFRAAQRLAKDDACVLQNLALTQEWAGQHTEAEKYWDGYFENLPAGTQPSPAQDNDYHKRLAFEGFARLATLYGDKERWTSALKFAQRAYKLRPNDPDTLEKLFHLFTQAGRTDEARRMLRELREARPGDPQFELYALDLKKIRNLQSVEEMIADIERILKRNPNDARVEVRANVMVANVLPIFERLFSQQTEQLTKVLNQIRYLPKYQIDWPAVREIARDLRQDFNRLRRLCSRCMALIKDDEQRETLRALSARIERKLEQCRTLMGG